MAEDRTLDGSILKEMRMVRRITIKALAEGSGVCVATVTAIEGGRRQYLADETLFNLSEFFGMVPGDFDKVMHGEMDAPAPGRKKSTKGAKASSS